MLLGGLGATQLLLSNVLVLQSSLLVELGHAVVAEAAVELQAIWCAVVLGEVAWAIFPSVAPLAILPKVFGTRCPWFGFCACTRAKPMTRKAVASL